MGWRGKFLDGGADAQGLMPRRGGAKESGMSKYTASWLAAAEAVLEAEFGLPVDLLPGAAIPAAAASFTLTVDLAGDWAGSFTATVDEGAIGALLEGIAAATAEAGPAYGPMPVDAVREEWQRLFRRICIAAAADLGASSGAACEVAMISPEGPAASAGGMGYQLHAGEAMAAFVLADEVEHAVPEAAQAPASPAAGETANEEPRTEAAGHGTGEIGPGEIEAGGAAFDTKGMELLLDVELEAALRFGSREMMLGDLLALGPGDVIQLDRALNDPVDLIIGDKIVARGEVVLVNGNFGLQIAEVAEPRKSLESIRCLF